MAKKRRSRKEPADVAAQAAEGDDNLSQIRNKLLESDSESAEDGPSDSEDSSDSDAEAPEAGTGAAGFSWSQLAESPDAPGAFAPKPSRPLERGSSRNFAQVPATGGRYTNPERNYSGSGKVPRGRKPVGVRTRNRLDAGRNYSAPDDDLLM